MSSTLTRLNLRSGDRIHPDQARALTARLLSGSQPGLLSALMHYETSSSGLHEPKDGFPPVRFTGLSDGFSLVGFGLVGQQIIADIAPAMALALAKHLGRQVIPELIETPVGLESRPYPMRYTVPKVVVQKKARHLGLLSNQETGKPFIEALLLRSIRTQSEFLGISVPASLTLNLLGCSGEFAAKLGHGNAALLGMRNLAFDLNASLSGYWSFGYIASKGYGLMNADYVKSGVANAVSE
jgi:hypothetical protein